MSVPTHITKGDVDPLQPLDPFCSLSKGLSGAYIPIPSRVGGPRMVDLSAENRHAAFDGKSVSAWTHSPYSRFAGVNFTNQSNTGLNAGTPAQISGEITVSVLGYLRQPQGYTAETVLASCGYDQSNTGWTLDTASAKKVSGDSRPDVGFTSNDGTTHGAYSNSYNVNGEGFYHIVGTYRNNDWHIYVDGIEKTDVVENPGTGAVATDLNGEVRSIGCGNDKWVLKNSIDGSIFFCGIWKRGLPGSEIRFLDEQLRHGLPDWLRYRSATDTLTGGGGQTIITPSTLTLKGT